MSNLFGFSGRIGRGGWWIGQAVGLLLICILIGAALALHDPNKSDKIDNDSIFFPIFGICLLAIFVVNLCSTVKRYHDRGKSGFWYFISFVPFVGGIWQFIECGFLTGDDGDNEYGPPPGSERRAAAFEDELKSIGSSGMNRLDDEYMQNHARQLAERESQSCVAPVSPGNGATFGNGGVRPAFGKR
jgi:uncharacterized membrane protein YhaH (DUF805 family)